MEASLALEAYIRMRRTSEGRVLDTLPLAHGFHDDVCEAVEADKRIAAIYNRCRREPEIPEELVWGVIDRNLPRIGQALARRAPSSAPTDAVRAVAREIAGLTTADLLVDAATHPQLNEKFAQALRPHAGAIALAWHAEYPPLPAWRCLELLARTQRAQHGLRRVQVEQLPPSAQEALRLATSLSRERADRHAERLSGWHQLAADENRSVDLDPGHCDPASASETAWLEAFELQMVLAALTNEQAVSQTAGLHTSGAVEMHRDFVERHLGTRPLTPLLALPPERWLPVAADQSVARDHVNGMSTTGLAILLSHRIGEQVLSEPTRINGVVLHELLDDVKHSPSRERTGDPWRDEVNEYLPEGFTEACTQVLLQRAGEIQDANEPVGYPQWALVCLVVAEELGEGDVAATLGTALASNDTWGWVVSRLRSSTDEPALLQALRTGKDALDVQFAGSEFDYVTRGDYERRIPELLRALVPMRVAVRGLAR
jgi:hypothetical protein